MFDRRRTWVAAIIMCLSLSAPASRTARAEAWDLWANAVAPVPGGARLPRAAAPTISPNTGLFDGPVKVSCRTATKKGIIHYTLNGATPTIKSRICKRQITVPATATLKARTFKTGMKASGVTSAAFTVAPPAAGDNHLFQVQWTPQTTLVDKTQLGLLIQSDAPSRRYVLNKQLAAAAGLDLSAGRVLVIYGIDFGKIATSTVAGNNVTVTLGPATLADAISDGTIDWDFAVPFSADRVQFVDASGAVLAARSPAGGSGRSIAGTPGPVVIKFKNGEFEYEITANLLGTAADLDITVSKELASHVVSTYSVKSHLESYRATSHLQVAGGKLIEWSDGVNGLKGDAALKLVVAGSGDDLGYDFPFTVMKVPFLVGPIPMSLKIGGEFVVNAHVPIGGSASVESKFTYDNNLGVNYAGTAMKGTFTLAGYSIGDPPEQPKAGGSTQMAASFGIGFPQIGVAVGAGLEAGGWFRPNFVIGSSFTAYNTPIPVCVAADAEFLGVVGYGVTVFGFETNLLKGKKTLFDYKKPLGRFGQCPP